MSLPQKEILLVDKKTLKLLVELLVKTSIGPELQGFTHQCEEVLSSFGVRKA